MRFVACIFQVTSYDGTEHEGGKIWWEMLVVVTVCWGGGYTEWCRLQTLSLTREFIVFFIM
jgi:hypothetical protein